MINRNLPFSPLPREKHLQLSKPFLHLSEYVLDFMPGFKDNLEQAGFDIDANKYVAASLLTTFMYAVFFSVVLIGLGLLTRNLSWISFVVPAAVTIFVFFSVIVLPQTKILGRMRELDRNLIPALRHMLIEIKSGVTLFEAMHGVVKDYGETSKVFQKIVNDITMGTIDVEAMAEASRLNPSLSFRRAIWQINNALRTGADVGVALEVIISDLTEQKIMSIQKYGQELNPWTMLYMIAAVIIPSLGITFLVILTSFSGIKVPKEIFYFIFFVLLGFQLFFMNFVKQRRPAL